MPAMYQKPESALKRAKEFCAVGKSAPALTVLFDAMRNRRSKSWHSTYEEVVTMYLKLCIDLRHSQAVKEGLHQYKSLCQQVNPSSLEKVISEFLNESELRVEQARAESQEFTANDIDDLDNPDTPENIMLKAVTSETSQARADHAILTPWLKFLWECYRNCLDLLRNNRHLEGVYHNFAKRAFRFCVTYSRKFEFKKLCELLRNHFRTIQNYTHNLQVNLRNPETQAQFCGTRMEQLDTAIKLELWQEAFKSIDDVQNLIRIMDKKPKISLLDRYQNCMADVFFQCGAYLFHFCALQKSYRMSIDRKKMPTEERQLLSSRMVCAVLAIPLYTASNQQHVDHLLEMNHWNPEKLHKIGEMLDLPATPSRLALVRDLQSNGIVSQAHPDIQGLFRWIELEFHPLQLSDRVQQCFNLMEDRPVLKRYIPAIRRLAVTRLMKQLSEVYIKMDIDRLGALCNLESRFQLERFVAELARNNEIDILFDLSNNMISFKRSSVRNMMGSMSEQDSLDLEMLGVERLRNHLSDMALALDKANRLVCRNKLETQIDDQKRYMNKTYRQNCEAEHSAIDKRFRLNEEFKASLAQKVEEKRRRQEEAEAKVKQERAQEEQVKLQKEREEQRRRMEENSKQEREERLRVERVKNLRKSKVFDKYTDEELGKKVMDDSFIKQQTEILLKEHKEKLMRLQVQEKKVDYAVRAQRKEELRHWDSLWTAESLQRRTYFEESEQRRAENIQMSKKRAEEGLLRLERMRTDIDDFLSGIRTETKEAYERRMSDWAAKADRLRNDALSRRAEERKTRRRQIWEEEQANKQRIAKEQEEQKKMEDLRLRNKPAAPRDVTFSREEMRPIGPAASRPSADVVIDRRNMGQSLPARSTAENGVELVRRAQPVEPESAPNVWRPSRLSGRPPPHAAAPSGGTEFSRENMGVALQHQQPPVEPARADDGGGFTRAEMGQHVRPHGHDELGRGEMRRGPPPADYHDRIAPGDMMRRSGPPPSRPPPGAPPGAPPGPPPPHRDDWRSGQMLPPPQGPVHHGPPPIRGRPPPPDRPGEYRQPYYPPSGRMPPGSVPHGAGPQPYYGPGPRGPRGPMHGPPRGGPPPPQYGRPPAPYGFGPREPRPGGVREPYDYRAPPPSMQQRGPSPPPAGPYAASQRQSTPPLAMQQHPAEFSGGDEDEDQWETAGRRKGKPGRAQVGAPAAGDQRTTNARYSGPPRPTQR